MEPDTAEVVDPWEEKVPEGMGLLRMIMPFSAGPKHAGDRKQLWNPDNADEVADAKRSFTDMRAKGYLAFKVGPDGEKAEQIHEFDPKAGKIIMTPPLRGG